MVIAVALPSLARADATYSALGAPSLRRGPTPRAAWKPQQCVDHAAPPKPAPAQQPVTTTAETTPPVASDEDIGHVVLPPVRRPATARHTEVPAPQSLPVTTAALPVQTQKREARTDGGPLDFVDDVIDSGDLVSRVATAPPVKLAPAPRLPKTGATPTK